MAVIRTLPQGGETPNENSSIHAKSTLRIKNCAKLGFTMTPSRFLGVAYRRGNIPTHPC